MRVFIYIPIALLLCIAIRHMGKTQELNLIHEQIATVYQKAAMRENKQWQNRLTRKRYMGADKFFIDNRLEKLSFLEKEKVALAELGDLPSKEVADRIVALEKNRLSFQESSIECNAQVQETVESLANPIECDTQDLVHILDALDDASAPQLLITDFHLKRQEHTFRLNLKLLKREYL